MRLVAKVLWVSALLVFPIVGCNEVTTPPEPLNLTIQGLGGPWFDQLGALEGVQVCEGDTDDNCETSDANGEVTLLLPVGQVFYTLEKDGFDSVLIAQDHPEDGRTTSWSMLTDELRATWYDFFESPYPRRGTGEIYIEIQPRFGGATFDLVGATGKHWYDAPSPLHATATSSLWGTGGFVELTPGEHRVVVGGTASQCALTTGWPGDGENRVSVPVRADYVSFVLLSCAPPAFDGSTLIQVTGKESKGAAWPWPPLEGAELCETDTTNCVVTDENGEATLNLQPNEQVSFSVTKDGYEPKLKVDETDDDFHSSQGVNLSRNELAAAKYESVMSEYPPTGVGTVRVGTGIAGATCELIDATGKAFYVDEEGQWSLDLEATTSSGRCGFVEVPPGEFQIELGGTGSGCVAGQAWPGDAENGISFLVRDGYLTALSVDCPTP